MWLACVVRSTAGKNKSKALRTDNWFVALRVGLLCVINRFSSPRLVPVVHPFIHICFHKDKFDLFHEFINQFLPLLLVCLFSYL